MSGQMTRDPGAPVVVRVNQLDLCLLVDLGGTSVAFGYLLLCCTSLPHHAMRSET